MSEGADERIARLLAEGLELFGQDRVREAVACWQAVLELDPEHREARDYLENAGVEAPTSGTREAVAAALAEAAGGDVAGAFERLAAGAEGAPKDLELAAALELLRASLYLAHRTHFGDGSARPRLTVGPDALLQLDLPPEAGFLLSLLDGRTRVEELLTVSGLDPFEALHALARLEQAGAVELVP